MEGLESEDENSPNTVRRGEKGRSNKKRKREPQADDLDDDFVEEDGPQLGHGLTLEDIMQARRDEDEESGEDADADEDEDDKEDGDEDDEEGESEEESDIADLDSSDEVDFGDDDGDDMNEVGINGAITKTTKAPLSKLSSAQREANKSAEDYEIPFTFECPSTHVEFLDILQDIRLEDTPTVIHRICVLYHIKLAAENRQKLQNFFGVLVDHLAHLASTESPMPLKVMDSINKQLFDLAQQMPQHAATVFIEKLTSAQAAYKDQLSVTSQFPDIKILVILRTLGHVFPTSDYSHPVATPAILFMTEILAQAEIRSEIDIGRGLFLSQLLHDVSFFRFNLIKPKLQLLIAKNVTCSIKHFRNASYPKF
jgi:nucleolar protein 14